MDSKARKRRIIQKEFQVSRRTDTQGWYGCGGGEQTPTGPSREWSHVDFLKHHPSTDNFPSLSHPLFLLFMHFINSIACLNNPRGDCYKKKKKKKRRWKQTLWWEENKQRLNKPFISHQQRSVVWIWSSITLDPLLLEIHIRLELWCGCCTVLETHQWSIIQQEGRTQKLERFITGKATTAILISSVLCSVSLVGPLVPFLFHESCSKTFLHMPASFQQK